MPGKDMNLDIPTLRYVRFNGFKKAVEYALESTLKKFTLQKLQECYPMVDEAALEYVRKQIVTLWRGKMQSECERIYEDRDLEAKLNELDEIVHDAMERQQAGEEPIHLETLTPEDIVQNTLLDKKRNAVAELDKKLGQLETERAALMRELKETQKETAEYAAQIEAVLGGMEEMSHDSVDDAQFEELIKWLTDETMSR